MAVTAAAAFVLLYACGRFESSPDSINGGTDGASSADATEEPPVADAQGLEDADAWPPPDAADAADAPEASACVYVGPGGGSSTSSGGCTSTELYSCQGVAKSLKCDCPTSGCDCGGTKQACPATGCTITAGMRAKCGFPAGM
jgi:hypothetical protein